MKTRLKIIFCLFSVLLLAQYVHAQKILSISVNQDLSPWHEGSYAGGARLYITGIEFADQDSGTNQVFVGPNECSLINYYSTTSFLVCVVPPLSDPTTLDQPIKILVNSRIWATCATDCIFRYRSWWTPDTRFITPNVASPGDTITITGNFLNEPFSQFRSVKIGDTLCDLHTPDQDVDNGQPGNTFNCILGNRAVGYVNSTFDIIPFGYDLKPKYFTGGNSYNINSKNTVYNFEYVPRIDGISQSSGSEEGGLTIAIKGVGFAGDSVEVDIDGVPCDISEISEDTIYCVTRKPSNSSDNYLGGRGLRKETFLGMSAPWTGRTRIADDTSIVNSFEELYNWVTSYVNIYTGIFKPPTSGNYTFFAASDDWSQLSISEGFSTNSTKILYQTYTYEKDFFFSTSQRSNPIFLSSEKIYRLESVYQQYGGAAYYSLAAIMPSSEATSLSMPEIQVLTINVPYTREIQRITIPMATSGTWTISYTSYASDGTPTTWRSDALSYNFDAWALQSLCWSIGVGQSIVTKTVVNQTVIYDVVMDSPAALDRQLFVVNIAGLVCGNGTCPQSSVVRTQDTSTPLSGTFKVKYGNMSTLNLAYDIGDDDFATAISKLGLGSVTAKSRGWYYRLDGNSWQISFDNYVGDVPYFLEVDTSNLQGGINNNITYTVTEYIKGTTDQFMNPIPSDYLFTIEKNPQIHVTVNGILASCPIDCSFIHSEEYTPIVDSVTSKLNGQSLSIVINGTNFSNAVSDVSVYIGDESCDVTSASLVSIQCTLYDRVAGDSEVTVYIANMGKARSSAFVTDTLTLGAVQPQIGSTAGGTLVTINGVGFGSDDNLVSAVVDSREAIVESVTPTQITIRTPQGSGNVTGYVFVNGVNSSFLFNYSSAVTPIISNISPLEGTVIGRTTVTITGTGFSTNIGDVTVLLGEFPCTVTSTSLTSITCKADGNVPGNYSVSVLIQGKGYASGNFIFNYVFEITSVSQNEGSIAGGSLIHIQGRGFIVGGTVAYVKLGPDQLCDVITANYTDITCATPISFQGQYPILVQLKDYYADCLADDCNFSYTPESTPSITSLDSTSGFGGDIITIYGHGFSLDNSENHVKIGVQGDSISVDYRLLQSLPDCEILESNETWIICQLPNYAASNQSVYVSVDGKGIAQGNLIFAYNLSVDSISQNTGSFGGAHVFIYGEGFSDILGQNVVKVGSTNATIVSAAYNAIQVIVPPVTYDVTQPMTIMVNNQVYNGSFTFHYSPSSTPSVKSINPASVDSITFPFTLSVNGTGFDSSVLGNNVVTIGNIVGNVTMATSNYIAAKFNYIPAGKLKVTVEILNKGFVPGSLNFSSSVQVSSFTPSTSSYAGGQPITIQGNGFSLVPSENSVFFCNSPCLISSVNATTITCTTSPLVTPHSASNYSFGAVGDITANATFSSTPNAPNPFSNLYDQDVTSYFYSSVTPCYIVLDYGNFSVANVTQINLFPNPVSINSGQSLVGAKLQGSNDGINYDDLVTITTQPSISYNSYPIQANTTYRYIRYAGAWGSNCYLAELQVYGSLYSGLQTGICPLNVFVNGAYTSANSSLTFSDSLTMSVSQISPTMGTTLGGTNVTFHGQGFGTKAGDLTVLIDNVNCQILSVTDTVLVCRTGARPSFVDPTLSIYRSGYGYAANNGNIYYYIDRWSDPNTWGGIAPPKEGESVYIPAGQNVLLDISPPQLNLLLIEGSLQFDEQDLELQATYIFVRGGRFTIGTESNPFQHKATITLYGYNDDTPQLPIYGAKHIAVRRGTLDLHGQSKSPTWTRLSQTAINGTNTITLADAVNWAVGDEIVIAPTSFDMFEAEQVTITAISGDFKTLTIDPPIAYSHYGKILQYGGADFDFRAEVGVLTRNIKIQGDPSSLTTRFGAHVMLHSPGNDSSVARIENVECYMCGQASQLGRYPFHLHMMGAVHYSYIRNNSIHNSFNRAVTVHGVHYLRVQNNVAYDVLGHTFFLEDGIETKNRIEGNLAILTRKAESLLDTDNTPASFWITNPDNIVTNNAAAGSFMYGFWYDLRPNPTGPSATTSVCPSGTPLGAFSGNRAHSNGRYGLRIFDTFVPRTNACTPAQIVDVTDVDHTTNPPITAIFSDFTSFKNSRNGVNSGLLGDVRYVNFRLADNARAGIEVERVSAPLGTIRTQNCVFVGHSDNQLDLITPADVSGEYGLFGFVGPRKENYTLINVTFINYDRQDNSVFGSCSKCSFPTTLDNDARTVYFYNVSYQNCPHKAQWGMPYKVIFRDGDGTLTGVGKNPVNGTVYGAYVSPYFQHNHIPGICDPSAEWQGGVVCDAQKARLRRFTVFDEQDKSLLDKRDLYIRRRGGEFLNVSIVPWEMKEDPTPGWALPIATWQTYQMNFEGYPDFDQMTTQITNMLPEDYFYVKYNYTDVRDHFEIYNANTGEEIPLVSTIALPDSSSPFGSAFHNTTDKSVTVLYKGDTSPTPPLIIKGKRCPRDGCPQPQLSNITRESFIRLWSNATQWPGGILPGVDQNVSIPAPWRVKLDIDTPKFKIMYVDGEIIFDDTKPSTLLEAEMIFVRAGALYAGTESTPFPQQLTIRLHGNRNDFILGIDSSVDAGNKVIAVFGEVKLFGQKRLRNWAKLAETIESGSNVIIVDDDVDWVVNDQLAIATSDFNYTHSEMRTIVAKSGMRKFVLDAPVNWTHYGAPEAEIVSNHIVDVRSEVALLSRNIRIEGAATNESYGAIILTSSFVDNTDISAPVLFKGTLQLSNVDMYNCGQSDTVRTAIKFTNIEDGTGSYVKSSVVRNSFNRGYMLVGTSNVVFDSNVVYDTIGSNGFFQFCENMTITNNLHMLVRPTPVVGSADQQFKYGEKFQEIANFNIYHSPNCFIANNTALGSANYGYLYTASPCDLETVNGSAQVFDGNTAKSVRVGAWMRAADDEIFCSRISNFTAIKCNEFGVFFMRFASVFFADRLTLIDNAVGMNLNPTIDTAWDLNNITDVVVVGSSAFPGCSGLTELCGISDEAALSGCTGRVGIMATTFTTNANPEFKFMPPLPPYLPWHLIKREASFGGIVNLDQITVVNFTQYAQCNVTNTFFTTNPTSPDMVHVHRFSNIEYNNVDFASKFYIYSPDPAWRNDDDCGTDMDCTGAMNVILQDMDGSLLGGNSNARAMVIASNPSTVDPNRCTARNDWNGYECQNANYNLLVFESLDLDTFTRRVSPVTIFSNYTPGYTYMNTLNCFMDHGWWLAYTSLQRESRFPTQVELGYTYNITFTGTNPKSMRFQVRGDVNGVGIIVSIVYQDPELLNVYVNYGSVVPEKNGTVDISDPSGANNYEWLPRRLTFVVKNEDIVIIQTTNAVHVSLALDTTVTEFYDGGGEGTFIDRISALLGIDPARVVVVDVRQGSVLIDFAILEANSTVVNSNYTNNNLSLTDLGNVVNKTLSKKGIDLGAPLLRFKVSVSLPPEAPCLPTCPVGAICLNGTCICTSDYDTYDVGNNTIECVKIQQQSPSKTDIGSGKYITAGAILLLAVSCLILFIIVIIVIIVIRSKRSYRVDVSNSNQAVQDLIPHQ